MAVNTPKGWIDDDLADAILTLASHPKDQDIIPREMIEWAEKAKQELGLIEFGLR